MQSCIHECEKSLQSWTALALHSQAVQGSQGTCMCLACHKLLAAPQQCCAQGCTLVLDVAQHQLFCCLCRSFIHSPAYDTALQILHVHNKYINLGLSPGLQPNDPAQEVLDRRQRLQEVPLGAWLPAPDTWQLHQQAVALHQQQQYHPKGSKVPTITCAPGKAFTAACSHDGLPLGLRGLNNLGNTCFMNSVLQAFAHAPLIRNFFLGDGHSPHTCKRGHVKPCLACELDGVINNMYSGERQPYSPVDFLYGWWTVADHLAEYQQQDAHEFYLSALSALSGTKVIPPPVTDSVQQQLGAVNGIGGAPHSAPDATHLQRLPTAWPAVGIKPEGIKQEQLQGSGFLNGTTATGASIPMQQGPGIKAEGVKAEGTALPIQAPGQVAGAGMPGVQQPAGIGVPPINGQPFWPQGLSQEQQQGGGDDTISGLGGGRSTGGGPQPSGSYVTQSQMPATGQAGGDAPSASLVEAIFGGLLRSDVTCSVCGHTSTAFDPFLDISLDMVAPDMVAQMAEMQQPVPGPPIMPPVMPQAYLPQQHPPSHLVPQPPVSMPPMFGAGLAANGYAPGVIAGAGVDSKPQGPGVLQSQHVSLTNQRSLLGMGPSILNNTAGNGTGNSGGGIPGDAVSGLDGGATELTGPLAPGVSTVQVAGGLTRVGSPTIGSPITQHASGLGPMLKSESGSLEAVVVVKEEGDVLGAGKGAGLPAGQHVHLGFTGAGAGGRRRPWEPGEDGGDAQCSKRPSPAPSHPGHTQLTSADGLPGGTEQVVTAQRQGSTSLNKAGLPPLPGHRPGSFSGHPVAGSIPLQPPAPSPPPGEHSTAQPEVSVSDAQESHVVVPGGRGAGTQHSTPAPSTSGAPPVQGTSAMRQQGPGAGIPHLPDPMQWEVADDISSPLRVPPGSAAPAYQPPPHQGMVQGAGGVAVPLQPSLTAGPPSHPDAGAGGVSAGGAPAPAAPASGGKGKKGGAGGKKGGGGAVARVTRCGHCYTCLHKHLKKGCLRNKAEREGIAWPGPSNDSQQPQPKESQSTGAVSTGTASLPQPPSSQQPPAHLQGSPRPVSQPPVSLPSNGLQGQRGGGTPTPEASDVQGGSQPVQGKAQHRATPERGHQASKAQATNAVSEGTEEVGEVSTLVEPACSHLAMQTEAWPVGQGQHSLGGAGAQPSSRAGVARRSPSAQRPPAPSQEPSSAPTAAARYTGSSSGDGVTLETCLRHYTRRESLTIKDAWVCGHCKKKQPAIKQMSIRRLPPVLCLHIKRFEHAPGSSRVLRKLQGQLMFPTAQLDLSPFMTPSILRARHQAGSSIPRPLPWQVEGDGASSEAVALGNGTHSSWSYRPGTAGNSMAGAHPGVHRGPAQQGCLYSLFAVVVHKGDIQGGHYITYVRCGGSWFCCDDAWITLVEESEVAAAQAYMLFLTSNDYYQEAPLGLGA